MDKKQTAEEDDMGRAQERYTSGQCNASSKEN